MRRPALPSGILIAPLLAGIAFAGVPPDRGTVRAAVAANFTAAAREIAAAFEDATGHGALLSFGSTGQLYAQIVQGAPFEVFLAADEARPERAEREGLAVPGSRRTYAVGRLVLFSAEAGAGNAGPTPSGTPASGASRSRTRRSPPTGGRRSRRRRTLGVEDVVRDRQVIGANVSQAHQFVRTGNAELGFLALSQVARSTDGSRWLVPEAPPRSHPAAGGAARGRPRQPDRRPLP